MSDSLDDIQQEILDLCLRIDLAAARLYTRFAENSPTSELATFWRQVASEEREHARHWEGLKETVATRRLPVLFDDPMAYLRELGSYSDAAESMLADIDKELTPREMIARAMRTEFFMTHPAFEALFRLSCEELGTPDAVEDYHAHINTFIAALRTHAPTDELALIGEMLARLWTANTRLAGYLERERQLGSLVPMCSGCKKIRDKQGNWLPVEKYVEESSKADVTHGLCETCRTTLYPEH